MTSPRVSSLSLRGEAADFACVVDFVEQFARRYDLPETEQRRLLLILEQLLTNAVKYGRCGDGPAATIDIALGLNSRTLTIEFSDSGPPFDPLVAVSPDLDLPIAQRPIGGFGLHIVRSLVDDVRYRRESNRNHLLLIRGVGADRDRKPGVHPDSDPVFSRLLAEIRSCTVCAPFLPLGPRPVVRGRSAARLLIISQAPGRLVHETGLSFNDRSGDRLRAWLALDRQSFYDQTRVAIMPIGFCYPGTDPRGGDRPPRRECAPLWHARLRASFPAIELTLLVGSYAINYYLPGPRNRSMSETIARWRDFLPEYFVLPHPSWRTTGWLRDHPWFENQAIPELRGRVAEALSRPPRSGPYLRR